MTVINLNRFQLDDTTFYYCLFSFLPITHESVLKFVKQKYKGPFLKILAILHYRVNLDVSPSVNRVLFFFAFVQP